MSDLTGDLVSKRGRKALVKVEREFQIALAPNLEDSWSGRKYQNVTAANFAEAGKMADGLARILKLNVVEITGR